MPDRRRTLVPFLLVALIGALSSLGAPGEAAAKVINVKDVPGLQAALRSAKDGDIIELKAGTYKAPSKGITITNLPKAFTIRAAAGATVFLDGQGTATILNFKNGNRARGRRVTFERLIFQNGFSVTEGVGGAATLNAAEARFVNCRFLNNSATGRTTGGGAVRVINGSEATFVNTEFRGNWSANRGGALEVNLATAAIEGGSFIENRTNRPGHKNTSTGGAIQVVDATLRVSDARFERNQAGWVGGAIYAFGKFAEPANVPKSDVTVVRSTFLENAAINDPGTPLIHPTQGGAIHVENQTTLRLQYSHLLANKARLGGGIDNYRAVVEVTGSQFQWNQAIEGATFGSGAAIFAVSNETAADGVVNRRPSSVTITDSLLQGGTGQPAAHTGGCVTVGGDASRAYGQGGASQMGTLEENRARIEVRRSVFADCDVQQEAGGGGGFGGALQVVLANLIMEDSMVLESDARGSIAGGGNGGGVSVQGESVASIVRTTFARNNATSAGSALHVGGSTLNVGQCRFFSNQGGSVKGIVFAGPTVVQRSRNVSGLLIDSVFSQNTGMAIWDADPESPATNQMRYVSNQFFETSQGDRVYVNTRLAPGGVNASGMNNVPDNAGNVRLFSPPVSGALLAAPSVVGTGAPPTASSFLHFAWSGQSASLNGQGLTTRSGLAPAGPGAHSLVVDGAQVGSVNLGAAKCVKKKNGTVCVQGGRFEIHVPGARVLAEEADTVFLALPGGGTLAVQVLDRRDENGHFWLAQSVSGVSGSSALSGHTVEITDTATGVTRTWAWSPGAGDTEVDSLAFQD